MDRAMAEQIGRAMVSPSETAEPPRRPLDTIKAVLRSEAAIILGAITTALFYGLPEVLLSDLLPDLWSIVLFCWLFGTMLWCASGVVRHAECLAAILGEPLGTLILTLAVISIEVSLISSVMLHGANDPTLARDTMFAVLMIILNGMVGLALLVGALRHREQYYNLQGAKAFLAVIIPLAVLTLILPDFTISTELQAFTPPQAVFFAATTVVLYGVFLTVQTIRHQNLFIEAGVPAQPPAAAPDPLAHDETGRELGHHEVHSLPFHAAFLVLAILPVVLLSKKLAVFVDYGVETLGAPSALGGVVIAILLLLPEGLGGLRAATANRLQRSVNILLGSALATIGLTVPAVLAISLIIDRAVELGLDPVETVLLLLTLTVSTLTFTGGRTNVLQGAVHLALFLAFLMLIFNP
jgi:Ca2+:H+ antiporter